jgi:hypothetical protein
LSIVLCCALYSHLTAKSQCRAAGAAFQGTKTFVGWVDRTNDSP